MTKQPIQKTCHDNGGFCLQQRIQPHWNWRWGTKWNAHITVPTIPQSPNPHIFETEIMIFINDLEQQSCRKQWFWHFRNDPLQNEQIFWVHHIKFMIYWPLQRWCMFRMNSSFTIHNKPKRTRYACNATIFKRNGQFLSIATTMFGLRLRSTISQHLGNKNGFVRKH